MAKIYEEKYEKNIEIIEFYKTEENKCLDKLNNKFNEISDLYKTDNTKAIDELNFEFKEKFKKINILHNNYIYILKETIKKYRKIAKMIVEDAPNIGKKSTNLEYKWSDKND